MSRVSIITDAAGTSKVLFGSIMIVRDRTTGPFSAEWAAVVACSDEIGAVVYPGGLFGFIGSTETRDGEGDSAELTHCFAIAHCW